MCGLLCVCVLGFLSKEIAGDWAMRQLRQLQKGGNVYRLGRKIFLFFFFFYFSFKRKREKTRAFSL
jgi:hypothetical protein